MKANELRIGNYYLSFGVDLKQVEQLTKDKILIDFQPIPLTEEWLIKSGFTQIDHQYELELKTGNYLSFDFQTGMYLKNGDNELELSEPQYVHQLQNLYFYLLAKN
jgi:hypothetical protein